MSFLDNIFGKTDHMSQYMLRVKNDHLKWMKSWVQCQKFDTKILLGIWLSGQAFTDKRILKYMLENRCCRKHLSSILVNWFLLINNSVLQFQAHASRWKTPLEMKRRKVKKWQIEEQRLKWNTERQVNAVILLECYV